MLKLHKILFKLEGFEYDTLLNLNLGYYHIHLIGESRNICTIILTWVKYRYKRLTVGVTNSLGNFQEKMNKMFHGFEFIWAYIDDILIITKGDWSDHPGKWNLGYKN